MGHYCATLRLEQRDFKVYADFDGGVERRMILDFDRISLAELIRKVGDGEDLTEVRTGQRIELEDAQTRTALAQALESASEAATTVEVLSMLLDVEKRLSALETRERWGI